jgi:hypothetical protein
MPIWLFFWSTHSSEYSYIVAGHRRDVRLNSLIPYRFEESVAVWQLALDRVGSDQRLRATIIKKQQEAQYGRIGQLRDAAYDEGKVCQVL